MSSSDLSSTPTSRLCIKNIPKEIDEQALRKKIMTDTKKGGANSAVPLVHVTDVKILRTLSGESRKIAFLGFKTVEQAQLAQFYWNKAFINTSRVSAEFAAPPGSKDLARPWSRYSEESSKVRAKDVLKQREELADAIKMGKGKVKVSLLPVGAPNPDEKDSNQSGSDPSQDAVRAKQLQALARHPALLGLSSEERARVLDDPRFHDYMSLVVSRKAKQHKFWDNDDQTTETNSLRAMYLAGTGADAASQDATAAIASGATYEDLMKDLKKGNTKKSGDDSDSDDDDDYFSNPALDAPETSFTSAPSEQTEMRGMIDTILKTETAAHTAKDDMDYLKKMQSSSFDTDSDEEDPMQDDDDDSESAPRSQKRSLEDAEETTSKRAKSSGGDDSDNEDETDENADNQQEKSRPSDIVMKLSEKEAEVLILETGRLFLRNLPFTASEAEVDEALSSFGSISELTVPVDLTGQCRGFGYVTFSVPEHALAARAALHNTIFQGRVIQVLPGMARQTEEKAGFDAADPFAGFGDDEIKNMSYKTKKLLTDKAQAQVGHNWNALFLNADTVAAAVSSKFGMQKRALLGIDDEEAMDGKDGVAVKMAVAETHMIQETKKYLEEFGVDLSVFSKLAGASPTTGKALARSDTVVLFKNIPFATEEEDIRKECKRFGRISRILLPPYKTMAIVEFASPKEAKKAFVSLAYRRFLNVPLFLEWAPAGCLRAAAEVPAEASKQLDKEQLFSTKTSPELKTTSLIEEEEEDDLSKTLHVKNLSFSTEEDALRSALATLCEAAWKTQAAALHASGKTVPADNDKARWRVRSATIARRIAGPGSDRVGQKVSMGYGFVEMSSGLAAQGVAREAAKRRGIELDGHTVEVVVSTKKSTVEGADSSSAARKKTSILAKKGLLVDDNKAREQDEWSKRSSKLIVRNVPFEATPLDIRGLFSAFGHLKRVRLPKKAGGENQHRGFAFVDFVTAQEARTAFSALSSTHLYGRHLVLEWAKPDETLEELREKAAAGLAK